MGLLTGCTTDSTSEPLNDLPNVAAATFVDILDAQNVGHIPARLRGYPQDLLPHGTAAFESWEWLALLMDSDGQPQLVLQSIDRLAVQPADSHDAQSKWSFRDLLLGSITVTRDEADSFSQQQFLQRSALGMAGSDESSLWLDALRMSMSVGDDCAAHFSALSAEFSMQASLSSCPEALELSHRVIAESAALPVTGRGVGSESVVTGVGWLRQRWGQLTQQPAAVLIDRVIVDLDDGGVLEVTRSKRRSGRGVPVVSARWLADDRPATRRQHRSDALLTDISWIDGLEASPSKPTRSANDTVYPTDWQIRIASMNIDLELTPWHARQIVQHPLGERWVGALSVSGSHTGSAIMEFQPWERAKDAPRQAASDDPK